MFFLNKPARSQYALEGTRNPAYAGTWYEADSDKLGRQLDDMLSQCEPLIDLASVKKLTEVDPPLCHPILAIVAPHAGYVFSGQAAAHAYKAAAGQKVERIFLLGPSHHIGFHGAALPMAHTFATPLGDLEVDKAVVSELKDYPIFSTMPDVHKVEHSLEMQLPFIRKTFGAVKIVPIVVGSLSDDTDIRMLAEILKGFVSQSDLVIVSSDFTHWGPRYQYEPYPGDLAQNVRKLDKSAFAYLSKCDLDGFLKFQNETKDTICGYFPLSVLMALLPAQAQGTLLQYYTSQDATSQEKENSVSYLAMAFSAGAWPQHPELKGQDTQAKLTDEDKSSLLKLARATLSSYVSQHKVPDPHELGIPLSEDMKQMRGAFVTLNKLPSGAAGSIHPNQPGGKELRGCIGYIWPLKPLYQSVIDNAVSAASRDHRFNPVQADELADICIEISVLTPPRRVASYKDIVLGKDGMVLFKNGHQAVFLPFVATEFGWDLNQTLTELSKKAGLEPNGWQQDAKFDTFQAEVFEEHPQN